MSTKALPHEFYERSVIVVARQLLGKILFRSTPAGVTSGRIVETEAYKSTGDPACHAARGQTRRNATMFGPPGRAYVYSIHARYCFNLVTQREGQPSAVLVRAIQPLEGIDLMRERRGQDKVLDLARGPARLCEALSLDTTDDGHDVATDEGLWVVDDQFKLSRSGIGKSPRIGVTSGEDMELRYYLRGNQFVSGPKRMRE